MTASGLDWAALIAPLVVAVGALLTLLIDAFWPHRTWRWPAVTATATLVVACVVLGRRAVVAPESSGVEVGLSLVIAVSTLLVLLSAAVMDHEDAMPPGELHFLLLASACGALTLVVARDLVTLVVSLELLSLPSIAMVGLRRGDPAAARSAWTFFLVSAVATAVTLMGISLVYGLGGSLRYPDLPDALAASGRPDRAVHAAVLLTVVGLLFKAGAVPFHMWIPDTYRGASVPVAAYLSVVSKVAAVGALIVLLGGPFAGSRTQWAPFVAVLAALSMTVGNLGALGRRDVVGLLAWSSIAQVGFVLAPVTGLATPGGGAAPVRYLAVYAVANLVAFTAVAIVRRRFGGTSFEHVQGLLRRDPAAGAALALAALTLAGFPPAVIGLFTKYLVLRPVVDAGYGWLAVVMALNVAVGLVYYLRLVAVLAAPAVTEPGEAALSPSPPHAVRIARAAMLTGAAALVAGSFAPQLLFGWMP